MKFAIYIALLVFLMGSSTIFTSNVNAYSCPIRQIGPPCQEFWDADAVFIALATKVTYTPNNTNLMIGPFIREEIGFSVEEAFRGVTASEITLDLDHCGYGFKENERYLVYAYRNPNDNRLEVRAGNTRTRPLSEAVDDLQYIRESSEGKATSHLLGTVMKYTHNIKETRYDTDPMKDIRLVIESGNHKYETTTDAEGRFQFNSLPEGLYRMRADIPSNLIYDGPQSVRIKGRGCVPVAITARRKNSIEGKVFDVNGNPMKWVPVSLVSADATTDEILSKDHNAWTYALTNEQGYYNFRHLAPGRYFLITNRTDAELLPNGDRITVARLFYPGVKDITEALVVTLTEDKEPQKYDFHLPQK